MFNAVRSTKVLGHTRKHRRAAKYRAAIAAPVNPFRWGVPSSAWPAGSYFVRPLRVAHRRRDPVEERDERSCAAEERSFRPGTHTTSPCSPHGHGIHASLSIPRPGPAPPPTPNTNRTLLVHGKNKNKKKVTWRLSLSLFRRAGYCIHLPCPHAFRLRHPSAPSLCGSMGILLARRAMSGLCPPSPVACLTSAVTPPEGGGQNMTG